MPHPFRGLALHTWTLDTAPFEQVLEAAKAADFDAVELRQVDFTRCAERGLDRERVRSLVRKSGLEVSAMGVEAGWIFSDGDERERLFAVLREACEDAVALHCAVLMSALGPVGAGTNDQTAVKNIQRAGEVAGSFGLKLAVEYQFGHAVVRSLDVLRNLLERAAAPHTGLLLDSYHLQRSGRVGAGFADVPAEQIFYVQVSDVPDAPSTSRPPVDRLAVGQGVVDWKGFFGLLDQKQYSGFISYEAPNQTYWTQSAVTVAKVGMMAAQDALAKTFDR